MFDDAFAKTPSLQTGHTWTGSLVIPGDVGARNPDMNTDDAADWLSRPDGFQTSSRFNVGQSLPVCGPIVPVIPLFETNDGTASLDLDGLQSDGSQPATTSAVVGTSVIATISSNLSGTAYEIGISGANLVRGDQLPGLRTANEQNINLNVTHPLSFLHGGALPDLAPYPGTLTLPINSVAPTRFSAQGGSTACSDPAPQAIDGGRLERPKPSSRTGFCE